ncbi:type IX secretion system periplasmic lipoprotein PorW/SprE [Pontimicrobium sp. MEBiC01747]
MKIALKPIVFVAVSAVIITSCSRKKDNFISRNFHAVTAEYNTLFNGYEALEKGRENLNNSYKDNYWEILPIERMQIDEDAILPGQSKNESFSKAEEKAVKAVQRHGMNIQGKEKNPQIDEAYLLLGKARYFDQRFVPALEAFNYILYKYPASSNINQAKVWREKTNIRLENNELAIKNLKRLLEQEELKGQDLADATSILAQAYINTKSLDSALTQISVAADVAKKRNEEGRYRFIQGQLYNALNDKDSANIAFDKVIELNRKIPRKYHIAAHVEKSKNFDYEKGDKIAFLEYLTDLEEDRENRPFLDKIYHQIGEYHLKTNNDSLAFAYYNKSIRTQSQDKILVAKNFETLGDMSFDANAYKDAGAYYDSTMTNMVKDSKPFRVIKRKRENLDDVIRYEDIAEANDSILRLVRMTDAERLSYFEEYTSKLKAEAEAEKERKEIEAQKQGLAINNTGSGNIVTPKGGPNAESSFYFYNTQTVGYGRNEFLKIWGERELKDNWRWSSSKASTGIGIASGTGILDVDANSEAFNPQTYIAKIPTEQKVIDSLSKDRNYAYYQLGLIYKEKFKEYNLSKSKFLNLLKSNPEERLILPSKYNLYKIYEALGENGEANIAKNEIIVNYPDSRYAQILSNPESVAAKDENSPQSLYENTYKLFEEQKYAEVIEKSENYITALEGGAIVPKFELLKATASGRLYGFEAYSKGINAIAVDYANTEEGVQAQDIINKAFKVISNKNFNDDADAKHFKVIYQFKNAEKEEINDFVKALDEAVKKVKYYELTTSIDLYNPNTTFVVVHGLKSIEGAKGFSQLLEEGEGYKIEKPSFAISSDNYRIIQIHKNLEAYLTAQ